MVSCIRFILPVSIALLAGCTSLTSPPQLQSTLSFAAVGDIMLGTDYPYNHLPDDDGLTLLEEASQVLKTADIAFGNLEGVLMAGGEPAKKCKDKGSCYVFRSPPRYAQHLKQAGFDVMSLANNHARDFGEEGRDASMQALDAVGIKHSGRIGSFAVITGQQQEMAVVAFAPFGGSNDMLNIADAQRWIRELSEKYPLLAVSFHGGAEGLDVLHIPFSSETFFGEDRGDVVAFARAVVDAGADIVIGHGPHVPRALELYKDRLIAYSLGNFATYYGISVVGNKGLAPVLEASLDREGRFLSGQIHSFQQRRPAGPLKDEQQRAARLIRELTLSDFPLTPLYIEENGKIIRTKTLPKAADK